MPVALITLGVLAQAYATETANTGSLHTWGVVSVVLGVIALVFWCLVALVKAFD